MDILSHEDMPEEVTQLGGPVALFRAGRLVLVLCWIFGVLAGAVGIAGLGTFIVLLMNPPANGARGRPLGKLIILGIGALSVSIGLIRKARMSGGLRVFVCNDGILRSRNRQQEIIRWDDINVVKREANTKKQELVISTPSQLILVDRTGREMIFNETVAGLRELREMVEEHTLKFMLPPAIQAFRSGAVIGFGEVSVSPEGIHVGREILSWELFEQAEISKGRLILNSNNGKKLFGRVDVSKVLNVHVLLALTEYARVHRV